MPLDEKLFTWTPKPHDESRFEYHGVSLTLDGILSNQALREADESALKQARKKLPPSDWTLDYILVTGNSVDPSALPLTHTFMFKRSRPGAGG